MKNPSLVLVGSGIKFMSHLTIEAKTYIEQSDKVLYLVNEPAMKHWIQQNNLNAESLDSLYTKYSLRSQCYQAMTDYILESVRNNLHICVVLYGHPTVFAQPGLDAAQQAKQAGFDVKILPGISAEDCLFADLLINPGSCGSLSFEATDFLIHRRQFDPRCHLILWQAGTIGAVDHCIEHNNTKGAALLYHYLHPHYHPTHQVILYEAAQYPHFKPTIIKLPLTELPTTTISKIATLYVPPARKTSCDDTMLQALGINIVDLKNKFD